MVGVWFSRSRCNPYCFNHGELPGIEGSIDKSCQQFAKRIIIIKAMIKNLLLTALRSLKKNKFFSLLNISGLAIGMAVFLLIAQYVRYEKSYEDFVPGNENIYRVKLEAYDKNELTMATAENYPRSEEHTSELQSLAYLVCR